MPSHSHRVTSAVRWRRSALGLLAGLAGAAAIVAPSTLATGRTAPADKTPAKRQTAPADNTCPGAPPPAITSAVAQLEQAGTIDQTQTQAIDAALSSECSFDLQHLVNNGTITATQAQTLNDALANAKLSLAASAHSAKDGQHAHHRQAHQT